LVFKEKVTTIGDILMISRLIRSLSAIMGGHIIIIVANLLLVPLYLKYWPVAVYGEWLALSSLASYVALLDFGMTTTVANRLTRAYAQDDLELYARCQHSAMAFYLALALGGGLVLALAVWTLPLPVWLGLKETPPATACWVVWLLGLVVLFSMPAGLVGNVYRTMGNLAWSQWVNSSYRLLSV
jgi:hypothetical protein